MFGAFKAMSDQSEWLLVSVLARHVTEQEIYHINIQNAHDQYQARR